MARLAVGALLAVAALLGAATTARPAGPAATIAVVAHPRVPSASLDTDEARRIFLLRRRLWDDGSRVRPVNLPASSAVRLAFSRAVLGRAPRELNEYFSDLYFHGTRPPTVLQSERAVLLYVARTRGAIGYVSASALSMPEATGLRVLLTIDVP